MANVVIIPCGALKRRERCRARDLYIGSYFKANLRYALSVAQTPDVLILSAKHGLIHLDEKVEPYDLKMGQPGCVDADFVRQQAEMMAVTKKQIYALGGKLYLDTLRDAGLKFMPLVEGLPMGIQMQALKRNHGRLPKWKL